MNTDNQHFLLKIKCYFHVHNSCVKCISNSLLTALNSTFLIIYILKVKVKGRVWGLTALQPVGRLYPCPNEFPSFIIRGATQHIGTRDLCQRRRELYKEFFQHIVIHGGTRFFYMPQSWDMGQILHFPSEGRHAEDFSDARKIQRLRPSIPLGWPLEGENMQECKSVNKVTYKLFIGLLRYHPTAIIVSNILNSCG